MTKVEVHITFEVADNDLSFISIDDIEDDFMDQLDFVNTMYQNPTIDVFVNE